MLSECRAIVERMNCECHSRLNFWAVQNSGSDQISPPRLLAFVCERQRTSANAERMLNYYWANWYESGAIGQFCKRFTFANGYSLKWDRALIWSLPPLLLILSAKHWKGQRSNEYKWLWGVLLTPWEINGRFLGLGREKYNVLTLI